MKKLLFAGLCCALLGAAPAADKSAGSWDARLHGYSGSVLVRPAGVKHWANARKGLPLKRGDIIRTGKKSAAQISLDGKGIVSLSPSSELTLKDLKRKDASLTLAAGRLIAKIIDLKRLKAKLTVRTPTAAAAVRGTEFSVDYHKDLEETLVNVFEEGEVLVTSLDEAGNPVGETIAVTPRHEVRVKKEMEVMTLTPSQPSRYKDPGIFFVRKKLSELDKTYKPLKTEALEEAREQAFGGKTGHRTAAYDEDGQQQTGGAAGGYDKAGRGKYADEAGMAQGGAGIDDRQKPGERAAQAKYGSRETAEEGGPAKTAAKDGKGRDGDDGDGGGSGFHMPGGRGKKGGSGGGNDGGRGKGGLGGNLGGDGNRPKSGAAGGGDGNRPKSGAAGAGAAGGGPLINPGVNDAISRPTSSQDKGVDTIVSRVQNKLASTGNDGVISNQELRGLVLSAAKTSATDDGFLINLNTSIAERLAAAERTTAISPATTLTTKTSIATSPGISITKPAITTPTIGTKDKTVIKKTP